MLEGEILGANIERNTYRVILSINLSSQSVSHYDTTTLLPTEHMVHTHTLVFFFFFEPGGISASFCLLAGIALQDDLLVILRFHLSSCWRRS
jgi:hypothetical protein